MCKLLTHAEIRNLTYDPETGFFYRNGRRTGTINARGYRVINMQGTVQLEHRLAWKFLTGNWPTAVIDHVNGDCGDNRAVNLRATTQSNNLLNRHAKSTNASGYAGVYPKRGRWLAKLVVNGVTRYLGTFDSPQDASVAYLTAKNEVLQNV